MLDAAKIKNAAKKLIQLRDEVFVKQRAANYPLSPTGELRVLLEKERVALQEFKEAYGAAMPPPNVQLPHCDGYVLHAPGECEFCDRHPDWQKARVDNGVAFTGKHEVGKIPCPSEQLRNVDVINRWGGNRPSKP